MGPALQTLHIPSARGWHDKLAYTHVIRRPRPARPVGTPRVSISGAIANGVQGRIVPAFEEPAP